MKCLKNTLKFIYTHKEAYSQNKNISNFEINMLQTSFENVSSPTNRNLFSFTKRNTSRGRSLSGVTKPAQA